MIKRLLIITLASVVILAGLLVGGVRLIDHLMPGYREALAERIGSRLDAQVGIDGIELAWAWRGPVLSLSGVTLLRNGETAPALTVDRVGLQFAFSDLVHGRRQPYAVDLHAPHLALSLGDDHRPKLVHWSRAGDTPLGWDEINGLRATLERLRIDDARIALRSKLLPSGGGAFDDLSLQFQQEGERLRWEANADGPKWFKQLDAHGQFSGTLPAVHTADIDIDIGAIDTLAIATAAGRLDPALAGRLSGGRLSTHLVARLKDGRWQSAQADLHLGAIDDSAHDAATVPALAATLEARGQNSGHAQQTNNLDFALTRLSGDMPKLADFALSGTLDPDAPSISIDARRPPMAVALRIARLFSPKLARTDIDADIDHITFDAGSGQPIAFGFQFSDLVLNDPKIRVGPLAGRYYQRGRDHLLTFTKAGGTLAIDHYLKGELTLDDLGGSLAWRSAHDGWDIDASDLRLESGDARIDASGTIYLPTDGAPVVDITARASAPDAPRLLAHIPQVPDLPNERLRNWLPTAIGAGTLDAATLKISGPLDHFPFAKAGPGENFHLQLSGHGVDVAYQPDWPPLENARGTLTLDGGDLRVEVASARMLGAVLGRSIAHVPHVREPVLNIEGSASRQPADRMLSFLAESPLRSRFAQVVEALKVSGPADLALDLRIPLKPGLGDLAFKGQVTAHGNTLRQKVLPAPITHITGRVSFDGNGLTADNLHGRLLGVAITTDVSAVAGQRQRIVTDATLSLPRDRELIGHYLPASWLMYGHGTADARLAFEIARSGQVSGLALDSDLTGMGIDLPAPMTKPTSSKAPLHVDISGDARRVDVRYDDRLDVAVRLTDGKPTRVQAALNDPDATPPDADGVWIGGRTDTLDGIGWFHVVRAQLDAAADRPSPATGPGPALVFHGSDMRVGKLNLDNRYFEHVRLHAVPVTDRAGWDIDLEGPNTEGHILWTQPDGGHVSIAGNFARLALRTRPPAKTPPVINRSPVIWADISPGELPRLDLDVAALHVDESDLGHARIKAHALFNGWQLDRAELADGELTGWATGRWIRENGRTRANAASRLEGHGLAGLLRTLGYAPTLQAKSAHIGTRISIAANPNGLDLRRLNGNVHLALRKGTLVSVEPGAARVLGLVNLYVLPRRLRMDFRDVVDKGLAFDSLKAHFRLENGNAYSNDVRIDTPSSNIRMNGRIGLAARDYDQRVTISPKLGTSVAIASGVLAGPLVGVAVLAFQELFKKPIQKLSSIAYTLEGSWDNPSIAEPSATTGAETTTQ